MDKQTSDILETIANFSNELSADVHSLQESIAGLKVWIRQEVAKAVEDARAELTVSMHTLTAQSTHDAKGRAQAAEKELADISGLLAMEGRTTYSPSVVQSWSITVQNLRPRGFASKLQSKGNISSYEMNEKNEIVANPASTCPQYLQLSCYFLVTVWVSTADVLPL